MIELLKTNIKSKTERPGIYPERFLVEEGVTWQNLDRKNYRPPYFVAQTVLDHDLSKDLNNPRLWAQPEDISRVDMQNLVSYEGPILFDHLGRPLNPLGPTGIEGRGLLGKWGPNFAVDPIITRVNEDGFMEMVQILRDNGQWAIPGGMVDKGEMIPAALTRELSEETSLNVDLSGAMEIYKGYVDDPRSTDHAWIETHAYHLHLPTEVKLNLIAGSDARKAESRVLSADMRSSLYASHELMLMRAIILWEKKSGLVVFENGKIGLRKD